MAKADFKNKKAAAAEAAEAAIAEEAVEAEVEVAEDEEPIEQPVPSGWGDTDAPPDPAVVEAAAVAVATKTRTAAATREYVVLDGPASYGPVTIDGQTQRVKKGVLYHIPGAEERADVLATGVFRGANGEDLKRAGYGSAGAGGTLTVAHIPPGGRKGGLR